MDIQLYATFLLVIRIASMALMGIVIYKQLQLFKLPIDREIRYYRIVFFVLAVGIFLGNVIPALIDIFTITGEIQRSTNTVNTIGVLYSLDAAGTALLSSIMIYTLYRNSHKVDKSHKESDHTLMNNEEEK